MQNDLQALWGGVREIVRSRIQPGQLSQFELWTSQTRLLEASDERIRIAVPDDLHASFLEGNFLLQIQDAVELTTGQRRPLYFEVSTMPGPHLEQGDLFEHSPDLKPVHPPSPPSREARLKPVVGVLNESYTFDSFVVGANNEFAAAAAKAVAANPARSYNPLFLFGRTGLGKTHLMHAIGAEILRQRPRTKIICVTSEEFANDFIAAIQHATLPDFRKRYRNADVLLIDDIQFLAGKERSQEEFFHTFNKFHDGHKQIVLTCDCLPSEINGLEKRLMSRFEWGMTAALTPPDVETRVAILRKKLASQKGVPFLPDEIIRFVAEKIRSNVRRLQGAILRVVTFYILNPEKPLTAQIVADEILPDMLHEEAKETITVDRIQKKVAEHFELRVQDLLGSRRPANIAWARQVAMYLTRELTRASYHDIGAAFGGRDHGTVMHACKKVDERCGKDDKAAADLRYLIKELRQ